MDGLQIPFKWMMTRVTTILGNLEMALSIGTPMFTRAFCGASYRHIIHIIVSICQYAIPNFSLWNPNNPNILTYVVELM